MEGKPGAQTGAAAAMVFKWAILVRHQILLHLPPKLLRVRLRCALRSDTFGLRFGLRFAVRLGVRFIVQFDGLVSDLLTDVICDIKNQQITKPTESTNPYIQFNVRCGAPNLKLQLSPKPPTRPINDQQMTNQQMN